MAVTCPFCQKVMKAASLKKHAETFHTDDQSDHINTVVGRGSELIKSGWDPYESTLQPRWDDTRYPNAVAPLPTRGLWNDAKDSHNALYDPRTPAQKLKNIRNPHRPNWEPARNLTETLRNPDSHGRIQEVFAPIWANKKQSIRGMPVIRRVGERFY